MIRTQIQLEEHQIQWLRTEAKSRGVSVSQLIREGVEILYTQKKHASGNKAKRALAAIGRFSSGVSDISDRHDDCLSDAFDKES
jgi:hypothetical protein